MTPHPCKLPNPWLGRWSALHRWEKLAVVVWSVVLIAIWSRALVSPRTHSVYPIFADAARNWLAGADLYQTTGEPYRYSPLVATLLVPLGLLPDRLGGLLWRVLNAAVYLGALLWWVRVALPRPLSSKQLGLFLLLVLPLSVGSLNNGQSNALILGLLLASLAAVVEERWMLTSACIALACLFKVYPIAVGLLLAVLYPRRFTGRLLLALALGLALPFLLQRPAYVFSQYVGWIEQIGRDDRHDWPLAFAYRDLRLLFRAWLVPLSEEAYLAVQLLAAKVIAGLCLAARRRHWPTQRLLTTVLGLSCCWMTLLGSATESSTYILLAPTLAWATLEAFLDEHSLVYRFALVAAYTLFTLTQMSAWFGDLGRGFHALGTHPLAALILFGCLLIVVVRRLLFGVHLTAKPPIPSEARAA